jgi:hypothetical protein
MNERNDKHHLTRYLSVLYLRGAACALYMIALLDCLLIKRRKEKQFGCGQLNACLYIIEGCRVLFSESEQVNMEYCAF